MANNTRTVRGGMRAAKGSPCQLCGTKYLNLYRFNGLELCYNCFKKHFPREWQLYRKYRFYAEGIIPFAVWVAARCPTNIKVIHGLRNELAKGERYVPDGEGGAGRQRTASGA